MEQLQRFGVSATVNWVAPVVLPPGPPEVSDVSTIEGCCSRSMVATNISAKAIKIAATAIALPETLKRSTAAPLVSAGAARQP